ncbi:hypothetical protein AJ80_03346 [Polytolypa hystricis UAMH7299]|uniref:Uncharacterized protein n=1 Tax=Polytolypa hystricis (strain UAMH7299) TaxID=1447883 RepID=A0A2B7YIC2_POLH7|nr:hypothetical protein AJ80_03346 [Polytolypa hystricis UAMH7299]
MSNQPLTLSLEDEIALPIQHTIFTFLTNLLQADTSASADSTASALDQLHPDKHAEEDSGLDKQSAADFIYSFWEPFHTIARQIPHDHVAMDKLVAVIKALKDLPPRQVHVEGWGDYTLWKDLPLFGETFSTAYNQDRNNPTLDATVLNARNLNFQSYAARLMSLGVELDRYCITALYSTLEGRYDEGKGSLRQIITDPAATPNVDHQIAVVAEWFKYAGATFYLKGAVIGGSLHGPLSKGPGKNEFSAERWQLWKERLGEFAGCGGLKECTRQLAGEIIVMMEKVETDKGGR